MFRIAIIIILFAISGCASSYKPPKSGSTASILINGLNGNNNPYAGIYKNSVNCTERESLSIEQIKGRTPIKISADGLFTFSVGWSFDKGVCGGVYSFHPMQGKLYNINYSISFQRKMCGVTVMEQDSTNGNHKKIEIRQRYFEGFLASKCKAISVD